MNITEQHITNLLKNYRDPYLQQDLVSVKAIKNIVISANAINIAIQLGFPAHGYQAQLQTQLTRLLKDIAADKQINITVEWSIQAHSVQPGIKTLAGVKNIIAVGSGKGGVGKSTTSVNLALALAAEGAQVGILDADIYGPNQPQMLGAQQKPESKGERHLSPVMAHGLQSMSIGYLVETDTPMIWRGPMVTTALQQLLHDTEWQQLDYLIIDLPPGTGDIQLTLAQKIPVSGAVIVTTPQDIALLDVRKAIGMFQKVNIPVLGVIENMSLHTCGQCGHTESIFGQGGGERIAEQYQVPFLGALPLDIRIRKQVDSGNPTVVAEPDGDIASRYRDIARHVAAQLSLKAKDYSGRFPTIKVEDR